MFDLKAYLLLIAAILLGVVGQVFLKRVMAQRPGFQIKELLSLVQEPLLIAGFLAYGLSTIVYLLSLSNLDLSIAYPTVSLGQVFIVFLSRLLFSEKVTAKRWIAVFIICAGVALVGLGSA